MAKKTKMHRKSPVRHRVRSHRREGKAIHSFMRGHGQHNSCIADPTIRRKLTEDEILASEGITDKPLSDFAARLPENVSDFDVKVVDINDEEDYVNISRPNKDDEWQGNDDSRYPKEMTPEQVLSELKKKYKSAEMVDEITNRY